MRVVIEAGSPAYLELEHAFHTTAPARKISLDLRDDGVAIKINEWAWSPTLAVTP